MSFDPEPLEKALKRLASCQIRPDDLIELQLALNSGRITVASNGNVAIGGDVS